MVLLLLFCLVQLAYGGQHILFSNSFGTQGLRFWFQCWECGIDAEFSTKVDREKIPNESVSSDCVLLKIALIVGCVKQMSVGLCRMIVCCNVGSWLV